MRVQLEPETHTYTRDGGVVVPGVTRILDALTDYSQVPPELLERKKEIGTAVHLACQYLDEGTLDWSSVDPEIMGYVFAWEAFKHDTGFDPIEIEQIAYNPKYDYACTLDRYGMLHGEEPTYIDIKAVTTLQPSTELQVAACMEAHAPDRRRKYRKGAVQLKPGGSYAWKEYTDRTAFAVFVSQLNVWRWSRRHGG